MDYIVMMNAGKASRMVALYVTQIDLLKMMQWRAASATQY